MGGSVDACWACERRGEGRGREGGRKRMLMLEVVVVLLLRFDADDAAAD